MQFQKGYELLHKKYPDALAIAYFQSFSNTYAPLEILKQTYTPFIQNPQVSILSIATRSDCLNDDVIEYLDSLCDEKEIWIELGLQSAHDKTTEAMNRGHTYKIFEECIQRLSKTRINICVHLINSLPNETREMMLRSVKTIAKLPIHAIKIHMLHVVKDSVLGKQYIQQPFPLLSREEYIDTLIAQLEVLPPTMIIQRVSGEGDPQNVLAPNWTHDKKAVMNGIDKEMKRRNSWQGKCYHK